MPLRSTRPSPQASLTVCQGVDTQAMYWIGIPDNIYGHLLPNLEGIRISILAYMGINEMPPWHRTAYLPLSLGGRIPRTRGVSVLPPSPVRDF